VNSSSARSPWQDRQRRGWMLRALGPGLPLTISVNASESELSRRIGQVTQSRLNDIVESYLPPPKREMWLAGWMRGARVRLYMPGRDRRWDWSLAPVLNGRIVAHDDGSSSLQGTLRVRRATLIAALVGPPLMWMIHFELIAVLDGAAFVYGLLFRLSPNCVALAARLEQVISSERSDHESPPAVSVG
jgi:hypothetical protein